MVQRTMQKLLAVAKVGALALALSVGGYLVVNAQRRANPAPSDVPANAGHTDGAAQVLEPSAATGEVTGADETFLSSSKSLVLEAPTVAEEMDPIFLSGSKSTVITDTSIVGDEAVPLGPVAPETAPYLSSSKSLSPGSIKYTPPAPKQSATPASGPQQP